MEIILQFIFLQTVHTYLKKKFPPSKTSKLHSFKNWLWDSISGTCLKKMLVASKNESFFSLSFIFQKVLFYISPYLNLTLADNLLHHCITSRGGGMQVEPSLRPKMSHNFPDHLSLILAVVDLVVFTIYKRTH